MKRLFFATCFLCSTLCLQAQDKAAILQHNASFEGAESHLPTYKVIYQLDSNQPDVVKKAFRNIRNLLGDPRLIGKLNVELITFSGGTEVMLKTSPYHDELVDLIERGVQVAQCTNSLQERKLQKEDIYPFIAFVPSGNGELVIRGAEGWVIIKP
ncbi:DsrE family protein [Sphingobacterium sp. MYb382]|uniref:DsrE family protein n=1 Tax=Sphingobacterium sp. MYb382 TaxID=2745278 RepID=UPI00309998AA